MAKTVVGLFDRFEDAQNVVQDLIDQGFSRDDISVVSNDTSLRSDKADDIGDDKIGSGVIAGTAVGSVLGLLVGLSTLAIPGVGPVLAAGPLAAPLGNAAAGAGLGAATGGLVGVLVNTGIPREDAHIYAEGVRRGGTLVIVQTSDEKADDAADTMQRYDVIDIDQRSADYRASGWTGFDDNAQSYTRSDIDRAGSSAPATSTISSTSPTDVDVRDRDVTVGTNTRVSDLDTEGKQVLPVTEEQLQVGKRQVQRGGVRIHSHVTETPIEEEVRLREERVNVERRSVDRPMTDTDSDVFKERTIEVTETAEEAVVSKEARVVEEVVVNKDVKEHTETVRDTVRRTDVDVEPIDAPTQSTGTTTERAVNASGFDAFDADFRNDYQTHYASSGGTYEQYTPVYHYGYNLGSNPRYSSGDWATVEPEARRRWEEHNPNTWDQFKNSIRYAWEKARGQR